MAAVLLAMTGCASTNETANRGRPQIVPAVAAELGTPLTSLQVDLIPEGSSRCTGAIHEYGTYTAARHAPADAAFSTVGRYSVLWDLGDSADPRMLWLAFHGTDSGRSYRAPPCRIVSDSVFAVRRVWVEVHPLSTAAPWHTNLVEGLRAAGWEQDRRTGNAHVVSSRSHLRPGGLIQFHLPAGFVATVTAGGLNGLIVLRDPRQRARQISYSGVHTAVTAGRQWSLPVLSTARVTAGAGPLLLRLDGRWEAPPTAAARDSTPTESWTAYSVGGALEAGFLLPLGPRFGFSARAQQRLLPAPDLPGHLGSQPFSVQFGHRSVFVGFGMKVW